ncbi:hypothetical protein EDB80DRAFT_188633 [Ilyonectria destructans]|nr:hypothetical protein EDB80DRAFT_188633 [Ilyonectria destructans]
MERHTCEIFTPQERPRTGGLQGETERTGPSSQSSSFHSYGTGDQFNTPDGAQNVSKGNGPQFPGAKFKGPVYFGTQEPVHPVQDCLKSLAFLEMVSRFHDIDTAAQGTCQWLLQHKMYTSWVTCGRGLLWIKGKPGSGKSTLLRYALNKAMEIPNTRENTLVLSFFFHGRGSELQKTRLGLFRSLLHQLLCQVPDTLQDLVATFQQRCDTVGQQGVKWQWHPHELQRFFESSIPKVLKTRTVWLFLDALDESGEDSAVKLVDGFQSLIQTLPTIGLKHFHVCFTCRHYPILEVDCALQICAENENRKDISTFVHYKLSSFSSAIPDLITSRAQGVFLWAWLVVKQVLNLNRRGIKLDRIEAEVHLVPQELDDLYRELIRNMGPDSLKLIEWICFAMKPLSLDELRWAMIVETERPHKSLHEYLSAGDYPSNNAGMKRRLQTLSCGLAEVDSDRKIVQFIHQSVKDFFIEKGLSALNGSPSTAKPDFVVGIAHYRLSRTCIRYLAMEEIGRSASHDEPYHLRSNFLFLHYATTSWVAHTKQSDARRVPQEDLLEYFTGPSNTLVERWVRIYRALERYSDDCPPEGTSLVHIMSRYGVIGALGTILERADQIGINIDGKDSYGQTPLWWAATKGHKAVVQLLLDRGAHIEAADKGGRTPLLWAAAKGHKAVVRLLLDRGAHIEAADKWGRTPLLWAAAKGHEAVVQLLLNRGAHIEAADKWGRTPLLWAVAEGHEAAVQLLLDRGAYIEAADEYGGQTLLSWAAMKGYEAVVRLLLDRGAYIEAADKDGGQTPLSWAAMKGHAAVVRLLLDRGAYIDAADRGDRTPLSWAAAEGHEAVVWLLFDRGAHIKAAGDWGRPPPHPTTCS